MMKPDLLMVQRREIVSVFFGILSLLEWLVVSIFSSFFHTQWGRNEVFMLSASTGSARNDGFLLSESTRREKNKC